MVTIKCIKSITDSSVNRKRTKRETFETTPERVKEMETALGSKFKEYFEVLKVAKIKPEVKKGK